MQSFTVDGLLELVECDDGRLVYRKRPIHHAIALSNYQSFTSLDDYLETMDSLRKSGRILLPLEGKLFLVRDEEGRQMWLQDYAVITRRPPQEGDNLAE